MKKFILKTLPFTLPFFVLYIVTFSFYSDAENPDLLRVGYIPNIDKGYMKALDSNRKVKFELLSETQNKEFKILTIGDSFSNRGSIGYNNMLADHFSVLNADTFRAENQFQTIVKLINGDFFSTYKIDYVILQNIERNIIYNAENTDIEQKIYVSEIDSLIKNHHSKHESYRYELFSKTTLNFPFTFPKFFFKKNYLSNNEVFNLELNNNNLFSNNSSKLLFYNRDLYALERNNTMAKVESLNNKLNFLAKQLEQRNVKLIVLPAPDKYDMYYSYIADKTNFEKPIFFENLNKLSKNYIYIDSKELLLKNMESKKDIYYFADTHWSPVAAKLIADEIKKRINTQ
ncbi:hypothetical protein SOM12_11620 [Flavobacterium sp. CFBP9031]|uniref:alginate O-acetyltransferase AlgX-related protein n=1 Tax=Flavobacterium sp. CFBP9031 TaxID=3096538 RepID=UPI002A6A1B26|nr:hypothetical protein [Flavobacterium sp. CFBP9031]MDY0988063.1 hypothetical protein [Flavobacterium sp. CFBP9031]